MYTNPLSKDSNHTLTLFYFSTAVKLHSLVHQSHFYIFHKRDLIIEASVAFCIHVFLPSNNTVYKPLRTVLSRLSNRVYLCFRTSETLRLSPLGLSNR